MTLRARITLLTAGAVALAVALAAGAAFVAARNELRGEVDEFLLARAQPISRLAPGALLEEASRLDDVRGRSGLRGAGEALNLVATDSLVQIVTSDGGAVFSFAEDGLLLPFGPRDLGVLDAGREVELRDVSVEGAHYRMITVAGPGDFVVQIARSLEEVDAVLAGLALRLGLIGLGGVAAAAGLGWVVARRSLVPVDRLAEAAEHVAATQDLDTAIDVERRDEIGRLASSLNAMLAALGESRAQQHRLVTDAGHELKTPLTALRTNIEVLTRSTNMDPDDRERLLADLSSEVEALSDLVNELVELATEQREDEPVTVFRLDALATEMAEQAERRYGRPIEVHAVPVSVEARRDRIARAVSNLLDNAVKFSSQDTEIEIVLEETGRLTVLDQGPGIADIDRPHVFERFYRADAARSAPGSGLGLAIVHQVVTADGGSVHIDPRDSGAAIGFTLSPVD